MTRRQHFEIAVAGCLCGIIGLIVGLSQEWNLWLVVPIGPSLAFLFGYRPWENVATAKELFSDLMVAIGAVIEARWKIVRVVIEVTWIVVFAVLSVAAMAIAVCVLPCIALLVGFLPSEQWGDLAWVVMTGLALCIAGALGFVGLAVAELLSPRWAFPMCHLCVQWLGLEEKEKKEMAKPQKGLPQFRDLRSPIIIVFGLQCLSICLVLFILDLPITFLLACASTERLAATLGATLCCTAGAICQWVGIPYALAIIIVGGVVGWFSGPFLYQLREKWAVELPPAEATT